MKHGISNEPLVWLPFSGGGMLAAMVIPVHVLLFGLAIPLGLVPAPSYESLAALVDHWAAKAYLIALVTGCLLHWAHRFRYALIDLGVHGARGPIAALCYGSAIAGSAWGAWVVLS